MNVRACCICGAPIDSQDWRVRYCSDACRKKKQAQSAKAWAERNPERMANAQERFSAAHPDRSRQRREYQAIRHEKRMAMAANVVALMLALAIKVRQ